MPEPEYILKPSLAPSLAKSVLIDIQTKPVPYDKRHGFKKKSRQIIYRVDANAAPALIEELRSNHSLNRLFVRGMDETPELAALHEKRLEHLKMLTVNLVLVNSNEHSLASKLINTFAFSHKHNL